MRPTVEQFVERLTDSGLLTADEIAAVQRKLSDDAGDAQSLARQLVDDKRLTPYQAKAIWKGKTTGLVLGNYVILDKLGQGGMGIVFQARHRRMERIVALKMLSPAAGSQRESAARFQREVTAAARLSHPNIVTAYDADEADGRHFLVMEFVQGTDLAQLVKQHGPLSLRPAIDCILQAARGLEYAHGEGVVHRDIKPSNLLIDEKGTVKVLDMGLARLENTAPDNAEATQPSLTQTGIAMGTADYMSPEQALDTRQANAVSDIYSLGCTLYYLLTGRPMYDCDTPIKKIFAHRDDPIPPLLENLKKTDGSADARQSLDVIYHKMVAKAPRERYQTMTDVIRALESVGSSPKPADESLSDMAQAARDDSAYHSFLASLKGGDEATLLTSPGGPIGNPPSPPGPTAKVGGGDGSPSPVAASTSRLNPKGFLLGGSIAALLLIGIVFWAITDDSGNPLPNGNGDQADNSESGTSNSTGVPTGGRYALVFDGEDDYVEIESLELDRYPLTQPLTIETMITLHRDQVCNPVSWFGEHWIAVYHVGREGWGAGRRLPGGSLLQSYQEPVRLDVPIHLAAVWDGEEFRIYRHGKRQPLERGGFPLRATSGGLFLGGAPPELLKHDNNSTRWFGGTLDEIRISNVARYTEDFPPPMRFKPDDQTLALYHCDNVDGKTLVDASGNGHDGVIHGAEWLRNGYTPDEGPIDLLPLIDIGQDTPAGGGEWTRFEEGLRSPSRVQEYARIGVPVAPHTNYRLTAEFRRIEGSDAIDFFLPVHSRQVLYVCDGFGGGLSGLQTVNKVATPDADGKVGFAGDPLQNGEWYTAEISVTESGETVTIRASLDKQPQIEWNGPVSSLNLVDENFDINDTRRLGLGAWNSVVEFRRFDLEMLKGAAELLRPVRVER